jgi:hypothetical protein
MSQKAVTELINEIDEDLLDHTNDIIDIKAQIDGITVEATGILDFKGFVSNVPIISSSLGGEWVGDVYFDNVKKYFVYKVEDEYYINWTGRENYQEYIFETGLFKPLSNVLFRYDDLYKWNGGDLSSIISNMVSITYNELKSNIASKTLQNGVQYRITDYVTTCNSAGSVSGVTTSSAGHAFDIIVTADSSNTLNANARVCLHEGDTYFANNKLSEWVVKYDINNNTAKYQWADTTNGKGVIYYMCDEFGNECPYDFKNIKFDGYFTFDGKDNYTSARCDYSLNGQYCYGNIIKGYYSGVKLVLNNIVFKNTVANVNCRGNSFDTSCYNNSFGNNCSSNKFGIFCYNNVFANACSYNELKNSCTNNNISQSFNYLSMGSNCKNITIDVAKANAVSLVVDSNISDYTISSNIDVNTKIGKNSSGAIKMYNEADLVG